MENKVFLGSMLTTIAVLALAFAIFSQGSPTVEVRTVDGEPVQVVQGDKLGAVPGDELYNEIGLLGGLRYVEKVATIAKTSIYSTSTLSYKDSGTNYFVSASGTTITLPAVGNKGTHFRFNVGGAVDTGNVIIASAEGDNIEGTLIVAGAVVDCDAEDFVNFIADGENIGDYVEVLSDGSQWVIVDSGVLTSAKMTCTDPS